MMPLLAPSGSSPHQRPLPRLTTPAPRSTAGSAGSVAGALGRVLQAAWGMLQAARQRQGVNGSQSGGAAAPQMLQCDGC